MSTLTIRLVEDKHDRLRRLAQGRGVSMNKLIDELATVALAQYDAEIRFRAMAERGSRKRGLELLTSWSGAFGRRAAGEEWRDEW
jgi:hypothetical protein